MNPQETEEVQRHINDLITKGLIRESLRPCAILALLVPKRDPVGDSSDDEFEKRSKRHHRPRERSYNDFKVDISEFEG